MKLRSVPDEEDADNSQVEDPEKCSQEEVKEIVEKVGEALEENFAQLERLKAEKAKKDKPATNGDAEPSNGTNGDAKLSNGTNGDAKPSNGTNGDVEMAEEEEKKAGNLALNLVSSAAVSILVLYAAIPVAFVR